MASPQEDDTQPDHELAGVMSNDSTHSLMTRPPSRAKAAEKMLEPTTASATRRCLAVRNTDSLTTDMLNAGRPPPAANRPSIPSPPPRRRQAEDDGAKHRQDQHRQGEERSQQHLEDLQPGEGENRIEHRQSRKADAEGDPVAHRRGQALGRRRLGRRLGCGRRRGRNWSSRLFLRCRWRFFESFGGRFLEPFGRRFLEAIFLLRLLQAAAAGLSILVAEAGTHFDRVG